MRVLIANLRLDEPGGVESVVRDLALGLLHRQHRPIVYCPVIGKIGREIRSRGIAVVDDLQAIADPPDIIHGHHYVATGEAIIRFPHVPVVNVCHAWEFWQWRPVKFPQVFKYGVISEAVRDRLIDEEGISPERIETLLNAVDLSRLPSRRSALRARPRRAACFSKYKSHLPIIRKACERAGITLDAIGKCADKPSMAIEEDLVKYDIVFAIGRSALEAACCGCAVVVCDQNGFGGMLTSKNLERFRSLNFALRLLTRPVSLDAVQAAIESYDASDVVQVSERLRTDADLEKYLDQILSLYEDAIRCSPGDVDDGIYRDALHGFLHATLPRTVDDPRWPWMSEREFFLREIERLDHELAVSRNGVGGATLRSVIGRSRTFLKHRRNRLRLIPAVSGK